MWGRSVLLDIAARKYRDTTSAQNAAEVSELERMMALVDPRNESYPILNALHFVRGFKQALDAGAAEKFVLTFLQKNGIRQSRMKRKIPFHPDKCRAPYDDVCKLAAQLYFEADALLNGAGPFRTQSLARIAADMDHDTFRRMRLSLADGLGLASAAARPSRTFERVLGTNRSTGLPNLHSVQSAPKFSNVQWSAADLKAAEAKNAALRAAWASEAKNADLRAAELRSAQAAQAAELRAARAAQAAELRAAQATEARRARDARTFARSSGGKPLFEEPNIPQRKQVDDTEMRAARRARIAEDSRLEADVAAMLRRWGSGAS